eukprot:m.13740 g.13740  ORF g.13740 m.13740 type:complete len:59 (-) comp10215_c0_seq2:424-600(-)
METHHDETSQLTEMASICDTCNHNTSRRESIRDSNSPATIPPRQVIPSVNGVVEGVPN